MQFSIGILMWPITFGIFLKYYKLLKKEISYLPDYTKKINLKDSHPLVGLNIRKILPAINYPNNSYFIIALSSSSCPYCSTRFEELLIENSKYKLPIIHFYKTNSEDEFNKFTELYSEIITLPLTDNILKALIIDRFPSYILISSNGDIKQYTSSVRTLFSNYINFKGGENNGRN